MPKKKIDRCRCPLFVGRHLSGDNDFGDNDFQLHRTSRCIENRAVITGILNNNGQVCNDYYTNLFCYYRTCI